LPTKLHNAVPFDIGHGTFTTEEEFQCIEYYPYTSYDAPTYGCSSADSNWTVAGELPPGLSIASGTGVISGTVGNVLPTALVQCIENFPEPVVIPNSDQGTLILGSRKHMTRTYVFDVIGFNTSIPSGPTVLNCSITVLKNFKFDVQEWLALPDEDKYDKGMRLEVYY
jgi:hypothetical protein